MSDLQKEQNFTSKLIEDLREKAERAGSSRAEFLKNVSEELQALLNRIIAFSNVDLDSIDEKQREYLERVRRSSESLLDILNDQPGISKVQSGKMDLPEEECNLRELFGDIIQSLQDKAHKGNNALLLKYGDKLPARAICDKAKLQQVMTILIGNAVKFSKNSIVNVRVQKASEEYGILNVRVEVQDHGTGIRPEIIENIFEPSGPADLSFRKHDGIESGLSISKRLLQSMHSDLLVRSTFGLGSTFYFTVPIKVSHPFENEFADSFKVTPPPEEEFSDPVRVPLAYEEKKEVIQSVTMNKAGDHIEKKHRILLAEDNEINQMLTERLLQMQGYETTVVGNGVLALKKYESEEFDLLLIDIQMPEMDGMELIRRIREKEKMTKAHVPVLVLTAHFMPEDLKSFIESGADGCITKPVMMQQLRDAIQKFLPVKA